MNLSFRPPMDLTRQGFAKSIMHWFFPQLCQTCQAALCAAHLPICWSCYYKMKPTDYHTQPENPIHERFWGRVDIHAATALFYYTKGSRVQQLIHRLKYDKQAALGVYLGEQLGKTMASQPHFASIDVLVPVPLHPKKKHQRGYNQAELIAQGIQRHFPRPILPNALYRKQYTHTQTKKSRADRFENVQQVFALKNPTAVAHKHVLLVDDVLTTGATLEACASHLLAAPTQRLSIACGAIASKY